MVDKQFIFKKLNFRIGECFENVKDCLLVFFCIIESRIIFLNLNIVFIQFIFQLVQEFFLQYFRYGFIEKIICYCGRIFRYNVLFYYFIIRENGYFGRCLGFEMEFCWGNYLLLLLFVFGFFSFICLSRILLIVVILIFVNGNICSRIIFIN